MAISQDRVGAVRPDDKFICSFPRSGNTWLRFLITRAIAHARDDNPLEVSINTIVPDIHENVPMDSAAREKYLGHRRLFKCHEPARFIENPMVYIVRRPDDTLTSLFFHAITFPEQKEHALKQGIDAYALAKRSLWEENAGVILDNLDHGTIFLLSYEQLMKDTGNVLKHLLRFLDLSVSNEDIRFSVDVNAFSELKKRNDPKRPMFRAGVVGDSRNHMKTETIEEIVRTSGRLYDALGERLSSR